MTSSSVCKRQGILNSPIASNRYKMFTVQDSITIGNQRMESRKHIGIQANLVISGIKVNNHINAHTVGEHKQVSARSANQHIITRRAIKNIIPIASIQKVISTSTNQQVVPLATAQGHSSILNCRCIH